MGNDYSGVIVVFQFIHTLCYHPQGIHVKSGICLIKNRKSPQATFRCDVPMLTSSLFMLVNDTFAAAEGAVESLPDGVEAGSLRRLAIENPDEVCAYYGKLADMARILRMVANKQLCLRLVLYDNEHTAHCHQRHSVLKNIHKLNRLIHFHTFPDTQIKTILRQQSVKSCHRIRHIGKFAVICANLIRILNRQS